MASDIIVFLGAGATAFTLLGGWPVPLAAGLAVIVALVAVFAARGTGVGAALFGDLPRTFAFVLARTPGRVRGAVGLFAAVLDLRPRAPAFVRLRLKPSSPKGLQSVTEAFCGAPGILAVESEPQSLLAHVMNEASVEVAPLQRLEAVALAAAGERR